MYECLTQDDMIREAPHSITFSKVTATAKQLQKINKPDGFGSFRQWKTLLSGIDDIFPGGTNIRASFMKSTGQHRG